MHFWCTFALLMHFWHMLKKKCKQQAQKTSLRAGRLTLHLQRNHNEANEPGSLSQGSGKRIELSAFTCMDWCWGHCRGAKHDRGYPRARAQGATFVGAPAATIKHLLVPLRVPTLLTDMLRRPASTQQLLAWSTSGELPMTMGGARARVAFASKLIENLKVEEQVRTRSPGSPEQCSCPAPPSHSGANISVGKLRKRRDRLQVCCAITRKETEKLLVKRRLQRRSFCAAVAFLFF